MKLLMKNEPEKKIVRGTEVWDTSAGKVRRVQGYMYVTNKRNWSRDDGNNRDTNRKIYRDIQRDRRPAGIRKY